MWAKPPGRDGGCRALAADCCPARPSRQLGRGRSQARRALDLVHREGADRRDPSLPSALKSKRPAAAARGALAVTPNRPDSLRALALEALDQLNDPRGSPPPRGPSTLPGSSSRTEALRAARQDRSRRGVAPLKDRLQNGSTLERQGAIAILASLPGEAARRLLSGLARPADRRQGRPPRFSSTCSRPPPSGPSPSFVT